uniref:Reverse transcriptase domain, reverse transcriptase zinc-binding domain protein n=1 Tax=Tanacetum cinerariifolium TaxID=118510 RepID=A0A6L2L1G4_TANCI|nr:reverse transcriptase domain, reverse transcriptase zinc-binding domain protein [Tanacetum cinerariifolium]
MVISKLEMVGRKFFWGGAFDSSKIAWIAWDKVISPLNQGGLGIENLRAIFHWDWTRLLRSEAEYDELLELESLVSNLHFSNEDDK